MLVGAQGECLWHQVPAHSLNQGRVAPGARAYDFSVCDACRTAPEGLSDFINLVHALYRFEAEEGLKLLHHAGAHMGLKKGAQVVAAAQNTGMGRGTA